MGAQNMRRAVVPFRTRHIKRVHLGPRRVVAGNIQRVKVIPIRVDARPFGDRKPHLGKDRGQLFGHL